ncbi:cell adhesion molecule 3-like isoform X2 [Caloenas nicobarica]|uniref:cell adhesion molecule 3-like isoform X2 n=1 Tax=Caloenas nicobarica TaxID=187106 RepID=UPI0032B7DE90
MFTAGPREAASAQPPRPPGTNGLFLEPYLIPAAAAPPAPVRRPAPRPVPPPQRCGSARLGSARAPATAMPPLGLLLLLACCGAARGNLSRDESQPTTSDETVVAGGTVVLKCQVEDPDDSSLQWSNPAQQTLYFGEKRALRDNRIQLERSTPNELTISISDVVLSDEGEYTCSIFTMPVRTAKALVTVLGIPQKPQIFGHEQPIDEEKMARLTCRSSGSKPAAQLRWKKGNKELKDEGTEVLEDPNGKTFTVSSRVEFRVTKEDNEAEVTCTVDHESLQNSERSTTQKLQVHYKPTAKIEPHPQYPREGEKLQLQCDGQGNPIPQEFLWEKEGSDAPLQLSSDSVLIFPFLNKSDSGTYVCTATSSMGSVVAKYNLDVSDHEVPWRPRPELLETCPQSASPLDSLHGAGPSPPPPAPAVLCHRVCCPCALPHPHAAALCADLSQLPTPHVHSTPAPPPGPSQPISHASMATASSFTPAPIQDASPVPSTSSTYHALIGGVVAVIVFLLLSLLIVLGHYLIRHKGTYLTHEAKGSDDAPDADTAIINAEGGQTGGDDKKEYFI